MNPLLLALLLASAHATPPDPEVAPQRPVAQHNSPSIWQQIRPLRGRVLQIWDRGRRPAIPVATPATATQYDRWIQDGAVPNERSGGPQP